MVWIVSLDEMYSSFHLGPQLTRRRAYLLTTCAFQLFYGKLYTFFSLKWIYIAALGIFEIGSAVCGAAPSSPAFIIGRAVAGVGAAGIFSGAILIVANTVPLVKRPTYTGMIGAMYGIASVAGPLMVCGIARRTLGVDQC